MPKLTYQIEHAPGRVYGTNSNELLFKEPSSHAVVYSTTTQSAGGIITSKKHTKQVFRGTPTDGVCIATLDEPSSQHQKTPSPLTMEMLGAGGDTSSTKLTLKSPKSTSWLPSLGSSNNDARSFTFNDASYTWSSPTTLKRDTDGRTIARSTTPWFWQVGRGLGSLEVDVPEMGDETERRGVLEVVIGSFVLRWWAGRVAEDEKQSEVTEKKKKEKRRKAEVEKEVAARKKAEAKETAAKSKEEEAKKEGEEARREQEGKPTASL